MSRELHPKIEQFNQARGDLEAMVGDWLKKHEGLSDAEVWSILSGILLAWANFTIRDKRESASKVEAVKSDELNFVVTCVGCEEPLDNCQCDFSGRDRD